MWAAKNLQSLHVGAVSEGEFHCLLTGLAATAEYIDEQWRPWSDCIRAVWSGPSLFTYALPSEPLSLLHSIYQYHGWGAYVGDKTQDKLFLSYANSRNTEQSAQLSLPFAYKLWSSCKMKSEQQRSHTQTSLDLYNSTRVVSFPPLATPQNREHSLLSLIGWISVIGWTCMHVCIVLLAI